MDEILLKRLLTLSQQINTYSECIPSLQLDCENDIGTAEIIQEKLKLLLNRLSKDLNEYFKLCNTPATDDISRISQIQLEAEQYLAELMVKIRRSQTSENSNIGNVSRETPYLTSRLPKLSLPEYSGDILQWSTFWDQFSSNIDKRNLAEVDKLLYLKAALKGDAKKAIDGLEITNKNYSIALATLKERFGRTGHIVDAHYAALYKIKNSDKTVSDNRRVLDEIERHLRVLSSLGENINHNHLRFLILEKFSEDIIYEMKMKVKSDTIEEMRRGLEVIISAREDASRIALGQPVKEVERFTTETLHTYNNKIIDNDRRQEQSNRGVKRRYEQDEKQFRGQAFSRNLSNDQRNFKKENISRSFEGNEYKRKRVTCIFCEGNHFNDQCDKFKTVKERQLKLKNNCFRCLQEGHFANSCRQPNQQCPYCKGKHNRALCQMK